MASGASKSITEASAATGPTVATKARGAAPAPPPQGGPARSALPSARMRLPLENVIVPADRIRQVDEAWAEAMAVTLQEGGELPPILTRPVGMLDGAPLVELVAGEHRLTAHGLAGLPVIECTIKDMTDAEAAMAEADENLMRRDLTPHERALSIAARLKAWAERFPDRVAAAGDVQAPKRGRPGNSVNLTELSPTMGFAADTAAEVGLSDSTVKRALAVARGLTPAVHKAIRGTAVARNDALLRQLAGVGEEAEQMGIVEQLLSGAAKSFSDARALAAGNQPMAAVQTPLDETLNALRKLWKGAPETHKAAMLDWLQGQKLPAGWLVERADG